VLDVYDEKVRGVSGRIGRPLSWPDYSRGSLAYTIESVDFTNVRPGTPLGGVAIGRPQLTSTFQTTFLRNSTNNPFYPTRGTRLSLDDQFTGGPFGGDLSFTSHRYEGRIYLPSIVKRFTSMFRLRVGVVGAYPWHPTATPDYARFRLGGGQTLDPL